MLDGEPSMRSKKKPILIAAIITAAVVLAGFLLFDPYRFFLTPRQRLAKRCVVRFWELHGRGWELREVNLPGSRGKGNVYIDGGLEKDGQRSPFYLTVELSDLPNGDCACDISFAEVTNDPSFVWEPTRIILSRD